MLTIHVLCGIVPRITSSYSWVVKILWLVVWCVFSVACEL